MPLDKILERIDETAAEKKKQIEAEASAEAEKISDRGREEIQRIKEKKQAETAVEIQNEKKRRLALKRLALKNEILGLKRDIINEAFEEAFEDIRNLPQQDYIELLGSLFSSCAEAGKGEIHISEKDKDILTQEFVKRVTGELNASGKKYEYVLSGDFTEIEGGFVIETDETRIDCSFEALFEDTRDKLEEQIGKLLFKNE